jgi:DNA-binding response OmpR family regulator
MNEKVLIVDDDEKLSSLLVRYLGEFGFDVTSVVRPSAAIKELENKSFDIAILDVMLPEMDGFALCRKIRETGDLPIIMLTARGELSDKILGLELGSDDYMPKPFETRELVARIRAILRRKMNKPETQEESSTIKIGEIVLNRSNFTLSLNGETVELTTSEFQLLEIFMLSSGRVLSREVLMEKLRGNEIGAFDRSLDVLVSRLRTQLKDDPKKPRYIKTIRSVGYMFMAD